MFLAIGTPAAAKVLVTPRGEGNSSDDNAVRTAVNSSLAASAQDSSSGWVVSQTYSSSSSCGVEASLLLLQAHPSGRCLPRYALSNDTLRAVGFKKYSCDRGVPRLSLFALPEGGQGACCESSLNRSLALPSTCSPLTSDQASGTYSDDVSVARSFSCSAAPDPTALIPRAENASFAINTQYVDQACGAQISVVQALRQDTCLALGDLLLLSDSHSSDISTSR